MGGYGLMALWLLKQHQYVLFDVVCAADDDPDQSERHFQRGPAHGGGRALAGLSSAGVLQPGPYTDDRQIQKPELMNNFSFSVLRVMWRSWRVSPSPPSWTGIK